MVIPEALLDLSFTTPALIAAIVATVLTLLSTALWWGPSQTDGDDNGSTSTTVSIEKGRIVEAAPAYSTPTSSSGTRRKKLSPRVDVHTEEYVSERRTSPRIASRAAPAAKRKVAVFENMVASEAAAAQEEIDASLQLAYGQERRDVRYYLVFAAIVYMALFLPTSNRLPVVMDLTWAGLAPASHAPQAQKVVQTWGWGAISSSRPAAAVREEPTPLINNVGPVARRTWKRVEQGLEAAAISAVSPFFDRAPAEMDAVFSVVTRPSSVLKVGQVFNASEVMGNRCFYGQGEEGCQPYYLLLRKNGKLQVREGREVGQGRVRWSARRRPNVDWARRAVGQGQWYELKLTEGGLLELKTGKGQLRWRSARTGGPEGAYEAFVDEQGRLSVFLRDLVQWRSR